MFWLEGGLNHKLLGKSQLSYLLDYRVLLIKTKNINEKYCLNFEIREVFSTKY